MSPANPSESRFQSGRSRFLVVTIALLCALVVAEIALRP